MNPNRDEQTLLAGILAHPDADLPRLVYADWLECDANPPRPERAEFIRVSCELALLRVSKPSASHRNGVCCPAEDCPICPLHRREQDLFLAHNREWFGDTSLWLGDERTPAAFPYSPGLMIRRGFVDEIRCPLNWWVGGECHCFTNHPLDNCPTCRGTGRTPAHGPALVRSQPVVRVTVTDKVPMGVHDGSFAWFVRREGPNDADELPEELFALLAGYTRATSDMEFQSRHYPTREAAMQALSDALLALAKQHPAP